MSKDPFINSTNYFMRKALIAFANKHFSEFEALANQHITTGTTDQETEDAIRRMLSGDSSFGDDAKAQTEKTADKIIRQKQEEEIRNAELGDNDSWSGPDNPSLFELPKPKYPHNEMDKMLKDILRKGHKVQLGELEKEAEIKIRRIVREEIELAILSKKNHL